MLDFGFQINCTRCDTLYHERNYESRLSLALLLLELKLITLTARSSRCVEQYVVLVPKTAVFDIESIVFGQ